MDDLVKSRYNPWREFIENVITGDNYFRASEYMQLLEYMDRDAAEIERQREEVEALRADAASKQARIDALMLEFCPEEMTHVQIAEWERHQRKLSPEEQACIDALTGDAAMKAGE